jgi:hypothetical protein
MLRLVVSALAVTLVQIAVPAQAPPDFSGQWAAQPAPESKPPRGDMGSGFGALDGSESKNAVMIGHSTQVRTSRAAWDGPALRITTTYPAMDPSSGKAFTTEVTYRLSLESPTTLVIEATRAGVLGAKPTTTRTVYQKNP